MAASRTGTTDLAAHHSAIALAAALPADTVLYLLLPMYASQFGVTIAEAGILLAANRLVRIAGYGWVARYYSHRGDRPTDSFAVAAAVVCSLGYATLSGFWLLLPLRLLWGLSFAALNLSTQATATAEAIGSARRSGRSRAIVAIGPVLALPLSALLAESLGPRAIFFVLSFVAAAGLIVTRLLPSDPHPVTAPTKRFKLPNGLDCWSFLEGLTLDGLFIMGLSYLGKELMPDGAVVIAAVLMALRYLCEIILSPVGGHMAERFGAERLLVILSLMTSVVLVSFGAGWVWSSAAAIVILRALQLPLLAPIVAQRTPGPGRVQALAARSVWRDIGAGTGPVIAGVLLPVAPPIWMYGVSAGFLALAAVVCVRR